MIQLNLNKLSSKLSFTLFLDADCKVMGLLEPLSASTQNIDTTNLTNYITGATTSKLTYIKRSFAVGEYELGKIVTIRGTGIQAVVVEEDSEHTVYRMYAETALPDEYEYPSIEYTDRGGVTTYKYKVPKDTGYPENTAFMLKYFDIIDEPILDTDLFINRGINNVFESITRLKTAATVQELEKTGFGFFKMYNGDII